MAAKQGLETEEKAVKTSNYENLAYFFKRPYSSTVARGPFRVHNKDEHQQLVKRAKSEQMYLWFASVKTDDSNKVFAVHPHLIDWESIPEFAYGYVPPEGSPLPAEPQYPKDLKCSKCGVVCLSTSGYTLHVRAHERADVERAEKYPTDLKCSVCGHKCNSTSGYTLHMKAHERAATEAEADESPDNGLRCPHCKKKCNSTSGLTLHMKSHA